MATLPEWIAGETADGKALPLAMANKYRAVQGLPPLERALVAAGSRKFRGLGDVVAVVARVTGVAAVVKAVAGNSCGCEKRRQKLNEAFPFGGRSDG